jgi:hypothetical protein
MNYGCDADEISAECNYSKPNVITDENGRLATKLAFIMIVVLGKIIPVSLRHHR